jgi:hypothetical protein
MKKVFGETPMVDSIQIETLRQLVVDVLGSD